MNRSTRLTVAFFGVLAGIAGIEHGIGEVLQGSTRPGGLVIESWPDSQSFGLLGGEPALTIVPNLLVSGILAIAASLVFIVWVILLVQRRHGALGLALISGVMLLVGAGFGPPLLGFILSITAGKIHAPLAWWRTRLPARARQMLASAFPWSLGAGLIAWLLLFPGVVLFAYLTDVDSTSTPASIAVGIIMISAFGLLGLTIITGLARDAQDLAVSFRAADPLVGAGYERTIDSAQEHGLRIPLTGTSVESHVQSGMPRAERNLSGDAA